MGRERSISKHRHRSRSVSRSRSRSRGRKRYRRSRSWSRDTLAEVGKDNMSKIVERPQQVDVETKTDEKRSGLDQSNRLMETLHVCH